MRNRFHSEMGLSRWVGLRGAAVTAATVVLLIQAVAHAGSGIAVVRRADAAPPVIHAGQELARYLGHLCGVDVSVVESAEQAPGEAGLLVLVGTADAFPASQLPRGADKPAEEGYFIETTRIGEKPAHLICGTDAKGALNGAYGFVELLYNRLFGYTQADIDFEFERGAAGVDKVAELRLHERTAPFYPWRGAYLHNLEVGVADLLKLPDGFHPTAEVWKKWVDWLARHKGNYVVIWPYNSGFNWWEYVVPKRESLKGLAPYSDDQVARAIQIRKELFRYAHDRGVRVFIGSYVPGGTHGHYQDVLTKRGLCGRGPLPFSMCLSVQGTFDLYRDIVREVLETYPEVDGLHYRWWAESGGCFCKQCEAKRREAREHWPQMKKFLRMLVDTAVEAAPDKPVIISGYRRASGDVAYARAMPPNVVFECKWGWGGPQDSSFFYEGSDWEPTPHHNVPEGWIKEMGRPLLIDHRLTTECSIPVGVDQSWQLQTGISETARKAKELPAVQGFPLIVNDCDQHWVVGIQFHTLLRLNWSPDADVPALVRDHFHNHYSAEGADDLTEALRLDGAGWSHYTPKMFWLKKYRFDGWSLDPDWLWAMPERLRKRGIAELTGMRDDAVRALSLCDRAYTSARPAGRELFWDFRCTLAIRRHYYEGALALLEAMDALHAGDKDRYRQCLEVSVDQYRRVVVYYDRKPGPTDGNEFDSNAMYPDRFREDKLEEIRRLEKMLTGEKAFNPPKAMPPDKRLSLRNAPEQVEHQGRSCYRLQAGTPADRIRIGVERDYAYFVDRDFLLEIEYLDDGKAEGGIHVEYDSHLDGPIPDLGNNYRRALVKKIGRPGWQRAVVRLEQCRFADRQHDNCDLTVVASGSEPAYIAAVRLLEMNEKPGTR